MQQQMEWKFLDLNLIQFMHTTQMRIYIPVERLWSSYLAKTVNG